MEKISIIVPCYNVEKYVDVCISSIINQTYKNIEVFLIDDGSTDDTAKIIKKKIAKKSNYYYFYKHNGGLSDARNFGLNKINSNYVCFIDSDDYIEASFVEKLYNSIIKNDSDIAVCGYYYAFEDNKFASIFSNTQDVIMNPCAWNKLYKTKLFVENNISYPKGLWYEDLGTTPKFVFLNCNFSYVLEPLYNYRQNPTSITHTSDNRIFDIYSVIEEIEKYCCSHNFLNNDLLEFMNIFHVLINTTYRSYNHPNYSIYMLKEICNYVKDKYPNWYKNKYIKNLSRAYKLYLLLIRLNLYRMINFVLKKHIK